MKAFKALLLIPITLLLCGTHAHAATIEPASIVLDDFANSAYFTITNDGTGTQTYSLGWKTPPRDKMVRFAPRRVTIEPGDSLIINLLYRKPANLPDGEYASELLITQEENPERFEKASTKPADAEPAPVLDAPVSFPVVVKSGDQYRTDATESTPAADVTPAQEAPAKPEAAPAE